jgi:hypothetical protein
MHNVVSVLPALASPCVYALPQTYANSKVHTQSFESMGVIHSGIKLL